MYVCNNTGVEAVVGYALWHERFLCPLSAFAQFFKDGRSKGNRLSGIISSSWNPLYCYVKSPVELWHFFLHQKYIFSKKKGSEHILVISDESCSKIQN